ncbi:MAG: hypothetical protein BRC29_04440 [Nanohaloarchaea archaeon SW_7_43_1]|nr:MAG: hypothetical protein BRC29_04440 [Nanohaloarchaea archaeon SW_7_43_1]
MKEEYSVIILSKSGDFLLENEEQLNRRENGIEADEPYIMTEDETAHRIRAKEVFIPYSSVENIQYGKFEQETEKAN